MASEYKTDILVVGGGLGGVSAALSALRLGRRVILTEETDWLGAPIPRRVENLLPACKNLGVTHLTNAC